MHHKVIILGNLGVDPELRFTPNGVPVCNFSVACNRRWTLEDGSQGEETIWFRITVWRRLAEVCNQYLAKGRQVYIEGRLKPDEFGAPRIWNTQDGEPRATFEVTANTVRFLGQKHDGGGNGPPSSPEQEPPVREESEDELPF